MTLRARKYFPVLMALVVACNGGDPADSTPADFLAVEDFLAHPQVKRLLDRANLSVSLGTDPPQVEGLYSATERLVLHDVQSQLVGTTESYTLRLREQAGSEVHLQVGDDFGVVEDRCFLTGEGDRFTIWRVSESDLAIVDCGYVQVQILAGHRTATGDLTGRLGQVLVGWRGGECHLIGTPAPLGSCIVGTIEANLEGLP